MVLFMEIQNLSREASQKEHLHFCTWSTTDNVPLPVTHYKDTSQWQEAISRPIIKINIPKSNFHISMHKPQHFLLLCLNFFIAYIYSSDTCCIKASFISLVLEIEISSKQILSLWCFSHMFFLSFFNFLPDLSSSWKTSWKLCVWEMMIHHICYHCNNFPEIQ